MVKSKAEGKQKLTKASIAALEPAPVGKRRLVYDKDTRGLAVRVTDKGEKSWYHKRWFVNGTREVRLGAVADLPPEKAQKEAERRNGLMAQGIDPDAKNPNASAAPETLATLYEWYKAQPMKGGGERRPRTVKEYDKMIALYLGPLASRRADQLTRDDFKALHENVTGEKQLAGGKGPRKRAANHLLVLLKAVYNCAIVDGRLKGPNPVIGVPLHKEKCHTTFLKGRDYARFLAAIEVEPNELVRDFVLLALYTGARKSNVLSMKWADLNLEDGVWTIAEGEAKNRTTMEIPLGTNALVVLGRRKTSASASPFVLPGRGQSSLKAEPEGDWKPMNAPEKGWRRIVNCAGMPKLRIHDLRHTMGSILADLDVHPAKAMRVMGHKSIISMMRYSHVSNEAAQAEVDKAMANLAQWSANSGTGV